MGTTPLFSLSNWEKKNPFLVCNLICCCYFFPLLADETTSLRPDKLSLPITVGEYDIACKIAHHIVTARKIMGVIIVIADKNLVFDT